MPPKVIIIEGITGAGQPALAEALTRELGAKHLALYAGPWKSSLSISEHMIADELAVQFALSFDVPVVLEHSFPSLYVWQQMNDPMGHIINGFKLMNLDILVANQDHKAILLRYPNYESWLEAAKEDMKVEPDADTIKQIGDMYEGSSKGFMSYIKASKMDWIISDPYPDPARVLGLL